MRSFVPALALLLLTPPLSSADDHLVAVGTARARLAEASGARTQELATLEALLATPEAASTAAALGADVGRIRVALPALDDRELRGLAARAAALRDDPAAGDIDTDEILVIILIVAIVLLVLKAVD